MKSVRKLGFLIKTLTTMAAEMSSSRIPLSLEENVGVQYMLVLQTGTA